MPAISANAGLSLADLEDEIARKVQARANDEDDELTNLSKNRSEPTERASAPPLRTRVGNHDGIAGGCLPKPPVAKFTNLATLPWS